MLVLNILYRNAKTKVISLFFQNDSTFYFLHIYYLPFNIIITEIATYRTIYTRSHITRTRLYQIITYFEGHLPHQKSLR